MNQSVQGTSNTSSTPTRMAGSSGSQCTRAPSASGITRKLPIIRAPRNRQSRKARESRVSGTWVKVAYSKTPSSGQSR